MRAQAQQGSDQPDTTQPYGSDVGGGSAGSALNQGSAGSDVDQQATPGWSSDTNQGSDLNKGSGQPESGGTTGGVGLQEVPTSPH